VPSEWPFEGNGVQSDIEKFLEIATGRRSVRRFTGQPVSIDALRPALEAFRFAPSAGNRQPWRLVIVQDRETIDRIGQDISAQPNVFSGAGALLVVYANPFESWAHVRGGIGASWQHIYLNDLGAAIQNLLLAIHATGLGAVWIGYFNQIELGKVIKTPRELEPIALIPVGTYDEDASHGRPVRRPPSEVFFAEDFEHPLGAGDEQDGRRRST